MTYSLPGLLIASAIVVGLLLIVPVLAARLAKHAQLRWVPIPVGSRRRTSAVPFRGEQLEARQMLDAGMGATEYQGQSLTIDGVTYENVDMIALAQAITDSGAIFYGADWCPFCTEQKGLFDDGAAFLPYVEVATPYHQLNSVGQAAGITRLPTWVFPDGTRIERVMQIEEILEQAGITEIPTEEAIYFAEIEDQLNLIAGQSYHVALDGYSPSHRPLTYTVTSASGDAVTTVLQGNKSWRIHTNRFGTMEFYLFEDLVPRVTSRIVELTESGFYDSEEDPILFHRVFSEFVLQAGDPNGTGTGGSDLGDFDDQFHPYLRHNGTGILSFAKTAQDDTNDSQFFIMEGTAPHLDFQHSVFGFLTEGEKVRESISGTPTNQNTQLGPKDKPLWDVYMNEVDIFTDTENAVLRLTIPPGMEGEESITVTVSDGMGNTASRTFNISYAPNANSSAPPFLNYVPDVTLAPGESFTFQLSAIDVDGDPLIFYDVFDLNQAGAPLPVGSPPTGLQYSVNSSTGLLQINTSTGLAAGTYKVLVAVSNQLSNSPSTSEIDYQTIEVTVSQRPTLNADTINLLEDASVTFNPLDNDTASGSEMVVSSLRLLSQPAVGELSVDKATGEITYTPPADFYGTVSFQYVAANSKGVLGQAATVTLVVAPVNDQPTAFDDVFFADEDSATLLPVLANDNKGAANEADDPVIISLPQLSTAMGGTIQVVGDQIEYTPAAGFTGSDTFTYTMNDGGMESTATVSVDVRAASNFALSVVKEASSTGANGFVTSLPQSAQLIDEWTSFWVEVWVASAELGGDGISAAAVTLNFDPTIFRGNSLVLGPGFTNAGGNTINNTTGMARLSGISEIENLGAGGRVLLGRVRFTPNASGLAAPKVGETLGVDFSQFLSGMSNASLSLEGSGEVPSPTVDAAATTRLMPMVYDLNDDGRVGLSDFSIFLAAAGNSNARAMIDFDLTGDVLASGFPLFQRAFGSTFDGAGNAYFYADSLLQMAQSDQLLASRLPSQEMLAESLSVDAISQITPLLPMVVVEGLSDSLAVSVQIVDLPGAQLARTVGSQIYIDHNAAGWGWFVDTTPLDSAEFSTNGNGRLVAPGGTAAAGRVDLLSVLLHELGHVAGLTHDAADWMSSPLSPGERSTDLASLDWDETYYIAAIDRLFSVEEN